MTRLALPARLRRWFGPSLARRVLVAQTLLLLALWVIVVWFFYQVTISDDSQLSSDGQFNAILGVADELLDRPEALHRAMDLVDDYLLELASPADEDYLHNIPAPKGGAEKWWRTHLLLWRGAEPLYITEGAPWPLPVQQLGAIEQHVMNGRDYRARTLESARTGVRATLLTPGADTIEFTMFSKAILLVPLLVSLPLLVIPAWMSVALALRPLRQVTEEIAARTPDELQPLTSEPPQAELRPIVNSVNQLLGRVRNSLERERSFVADAAHELRTPLAAARMNAEALRTHALPTASQPLLEGLLNSTERATHLVQQLLALRRSEAHRAAQPRQPVDLAGLLEQRMAVWEPLARQRRVELQLDSGEAVTLDADAGDMVSLLDNLLDNAIKYSPTGGLVQVRLQRQDSRLCLDVKDQGPGIAPALRERVFNRFFRAPDQTQTGSGLGLSIVRTVLDRYGGRIELTDNPGGGLWVRVELEGGGRALHAGLAS